MEGRCRSTTSTACTGLVLIGLSSSRGSGMLRPVSTSWSMCQLTKDTNLMDTLKGRSFPPSPGRVTSRSTFGEKERKKRGWERTTKIRSKESEFSKGRIQVLFIHVMSVSLFSSIPLQGPQAVGWLCTGSSFHHRLACDPRRLSP